MREAAGVAIFNRTGELLLGRHAHDLRWATFGGAVEEHETIRDAAHREAREEIGLDLGNLSKLGRFQGSPIYDVRYPDGTIETYAVTMFIAPIPENQTPRADLREILEVEWASQSRIHEFDLASDMTEIVPAFFHWHHTRGAHAAP